MKHQIRLITLLKRISAFTLVAGVLVVGCSAESDQDGTVASTAERLQSTAHYYLRCNATGWGADQASRLVPDASGQLATLTYDVEWAWMLQDSCVITQTNQLNGWGTQQSTHRAATSPLVAPGSSGVVAGSSFQIAYDELGTYTATLDLSNDTLSITPGSGGDPAACGVDGATTPPATMTRANRDGYFVTPSAAATEMPWGEGTTWNYTTTAPASNWTSPSFDDSAWQSAPGGFYQNSRLGDVPTTPWPSGESDLWLRTTIELSDCDTEHLLFWARWDDTMEVYINGVLANDQNGWSAGYRYLGLKQGAKSALAVGPNTIAVHVQDTDDGGKYFDLGLVRNDKMSDRVENGDDPATPAVEQFAIATKKFMIENGIPAGTLAVMKEDTLVLSKSFGYADKYFTDELQEGAVLRLASVDKPVSLFAMQDLIDSNTLDPATGQPLSRNTPVYPLLVHTGLTPPPGVTVSENADIHDVTIGMLLEHKSGLQELPPASVIASSFGISEEQIVLEHNVRWMTSMPANFPPGTQERYCSSCYMLVRHIVEVLTGDVVAQIRNVTLAPAADSGIFLAAERLDDRHESEPWYATFESPYSRWAYLEEYRALSGTAPGLVRMLRRYEAESGVKLLDPATGQWSLGIHGNGGHIYTGGMEGTASLANQRRWDEVNIAFIFNVGANFDALFQELDQLANNMSESDWGI